MPTRGQAQFFHENINSFIGFLFIASYALGVGLILWSAITKENPLANIMEKEMHANKVMQGEY